LFAASEKPVIDPQEGGQRQIPPHQRLLLVGTGCGLLALLLMAAWLPPDPRGLGTHQQLGLPPCTVRQLTGWRCPSCGMTTSWSHLVRGQVWDSLRANSGGTLLGLTCLILAPWSLASGVRGRWLGQPPGPAASVALTLILLAVTLVDWVIRLVLVP
jgi:hypothetical protein